jgi:hypothetical protein
MSEASSSPRRILHLVIEGFPADQAKALSEPSTGTEEVVEIFPLTEANAGEALKKIFAADTVAIWGSV